MNKEAYIRELQLRLKGLKEDEIKDAISYCEEYFDDAGIGNEQQVIDDLGMPGKFAAQMKADAAIRQTREGYQGSSKRSDKKTSMKNITMIVGGIFALPIALPLLVAVVILLFAFGLTLFALLFACFITVVAILFAGIPLLFNGFMIFETPGNALISIGGGLLCIGIGLFMVIGFTALLRTVMPAFNNAVTSLYRRAKEGAAHEKA